MIIHFFGTGAGGSPGSKRFRSSTLFEFDDDRILLVDCGVGCHYRLSDKGLLTEVDTVFITHSHIDHFLGLPEFLFQAHLEGRKKELTVYAPRIVGRMIEVVAPYLYTSLGFKWELKNIEPRTINELGDNKLFFCRACHPTAEEAYALLIQTSGGLRIAYSGDTSEPCQDFLECIGGRADVLIHEATCNENNKDVCYKYGHTTTMEAVELGEKLGAKLTILNHIDEYFNSTIIQDVARLRLKYRTKILVPNDLDSIYI
ncbi:MBL fold metallo-hydrolase [Thermococcus sp. Bubb.Bath]|uniref:MBL fold metallo-hydrolase n=1 Tax=Thermococcus sp. Bubb.Bath TaxID=1638242 RepID=UPI00143BEFE4|nr:MBL fold metallo-hydrolase [Thermococcus sp. Bubb.Bath]NJF25749.1 MBL fold metallo-hydrolase [Thermococcus sp. Bubb.Bath]